MPKRDKVLTGLLVRAFGSSDLSRLQEVRRAAFAPVFASFREIVGPAIYEHALGKVDEEQAKLLEELCGEESSYSVLVAERQGEVVGFVSYVVHAEKRFGEIGLNAVHPAHENRGIGTHLYQVVLDRMKTAGVKAVEVGTGGDPSHAPARRAYEKVGFTKALPSFALYRELE